MQSLIILFTLFQASTLGVAYDKFSYGQDSEIISLLMKKIWVLEERDRAFDRKIEEIGVLKERLDEAYRRLTNMQELEHKLQKAEERIQMLVNRMDENNSDCNVKKTDSMKILDTNETQVNMEIGSSSSNWIRRTVSKKAPRQTKLDDKITAIVSFNNRIQTVQNMVAITGIKRTVTRKAAFTAMFSSTPVTIPVGHSLLFDRVDYNEGNAYDPKTGTFTCPVSGTYFFFTSILSMLHDAKVQTEIVVDGLGKGKTHAFGDADVDQGSTAAALHCNAGQRVWVQCTLGSETWGQMYSTFTGILLWPDDAATTSN